MRCRCSKSRARGSLPRWRSFQGLNPVRLVLVAYRSARWLIMKQAAPKCFSHPKFRQQLSCLTLLLPFRPGLRPSRSRDARFDF